MLCAIFAPKVPAQYRIPTSPILGIFGMNSPNVSLVVVDTSVSNSDKLRLSGGGTETWLEFSNRLENLIPEVVNAVSSRKKNGLARRKNDREKLSRLCQPILTNWKTLAPQFDALARSERVVRIVNRAYSSGHQAAVSEVQLLLEVLDSPVYTKAIMEGCPPQPTDGFNTTFLASSGEWQNDFVDLQTFIRRERKWLLSGEKLDALCSNLCLPRLPWPISVDLPADTVWYAKQSFRVKPNTASFVHRLIEAWPNWFAAQKNGFSKVGREKEDLPEIIAGKIESKTGCGQRFKLK